MYRGRDSEPHRAFLDSAGADRLYSPPPVARHPRATTQPIRQGETLLAAKTASFRPLARACAQTLAAAALAAGTAQAQEAGLEEVIVTAQRRAENMQEVPISVAALDGERMDALFEGGEDIRALATRVPSLYAESSNGRISPRFYIRGLGNTDFDLAASQPVSVIVDEVVLENVVLKSTPLFDLERVEVLRGPQGTLFGRNTPAGIVKFDTVEAQPGFRRRLSRLSYGELDTANVQGAIGGGLTDTVSARASPSCTSRAATGSTTRSRRRERRDGRLSTSSRGGRSCCSSRPSQFALLFNVHGRDIDGTASIFRANVLGPGSDGFNSNYDRDSVSTFDEGRRQPAGRRGLGRLAPARVRLRRRHDADLDHRLRDHREQEPRRHRRRIRRRLPAVRRTLPAGQHAGRPVHPVPVRPPRTASTTSTSSRRRFRIASQATEQLFWQAGVYYFDSKFSVTRHVHSDFRPRMPASSFTPTTVTHENTAWAVFGHVSYDVSDAEPDTHRWRCVTPTMTRTCPRANEVRTRGAGRVSDEQVSGDISALYRVSDAVQHLRSVRDADSGHRPSRAGTSRSSSSRRSRTRRRSIRSRRASSPFSRTIACG